MTFCKKCWTSYTEKTLPAECPHIEGPYMTIGGVPRSAASIALLACTCGCCDEGDDDDE